MCPSPEVGSDRADSRDAIGALLAEHSALRDEVLQRDTALNHFLMAAGIYLLGIIALALEFESWRLGALLTVGLSAVLYLIFRFIEHDVLMCAARLSAIEDEVNRRLGERLMIWESTCGLRSIGYLDRLLYALHWRHLE